MDKRRLERAIASDPQNKELLERYLELLQRLGRTIPLIRLNNTWYPVVNLKVLFTKKGQRFDERDFYSSLGIITLINGWEFYVIDNEERRVPYYFWEDFASALDGGVEYYQQTEYKIPSQGPTEEVDDSGYFFNVLNIEHGPYDTEQEALKDQQEVLKDFNLNHIYNLRDIIEDPKIPAFTLNYDYQQPSDPDNDYNQLFEKLLEDAFNENYSPYVFGEEVGLIPIVSEKNWKWVKDI